MAQIPLISAQLYELGKKFQRVARKLSDDYATTNGVKGLGQYDKKMSNKNRAEIIYFMSKAGIEIKQLLEALTDEIKKEEKISKEKTSFEEINLDYDTDPKPSAEKEKMQEVKKGSFLIKK